MSIVSNVTLLQLVTRSNVSLFQFVDNSFLRAQGRSDISVIHVICI